MCAGFEKVTKIHLEANEFTVENGLLTPSFKLKRHEATQIFQKAIDVLYGVAARM